MDQSMWGSESIFGSILRLGLLTQELEIPLAGHDGRAEIVLDDEDRHRSVPRDDDRADNARLGEYHVVALFANEAEAVSFEDAYELLVRNRPKLLGHGAAEAAVRPAACSRTPGPRACRHA